ncbi:MAG: hypothetical protein IJI68_05595 [Eggerthellaceae bacterium]|nr:hypothetical protein [Eggerthellaceae bacterium]
MSNAEIESREEPLAVDAIDDRASNEEAQVTGTSQDEEPIEGGKAEEAPQEAQGDESKVRLPSLFWALVPILAMVALMLYVFGFVADSEIYDAAHMPLLCSTIIACAVGIAYGRSFKYMMEGIVSRLLVSMEAILILLLVGLLISSFMISGTIPALIYYGLMLLTPQTFLPIGCVICAVVGWACGSSWTATATVGIAFMTIGAGLGVNPALTAGMVISGAYVGDKFSPLSDTTNLAAAVSGTGLFDHVRAMFSTTGPVFLIALVLYTFFGLSTASDGYDPSVAQGIQDAIAGTFNVNPVVLLPVLVIVAVCILRVPGLVGVTASILVGVAFALIFQVPYNMADMFSILHYGPSIVTGNEFVDAALAKGGLDNQLWTISLVILAVSFGGALERCGTVERLFAGLKRTLHKVGTLTGCTLLTSIFCDAVMCDQFLGIGIPAPLYADKYDEMGLARNMLSRTLEDAGTMWSPLFPWTACGAYQMGVLGLNPFMYFPFAFVNLLSPIYAFITASLGRNIFWADGSYTNILGKTKAGAPAACPEEVRELALANLEAARKAGRAPYPTA